VNENYLDVARLVLDHQLLDANYVECGKVDDVELSGGVGRLEVTALVTGPGAAAGRLPRLLRGLARILLGARVTRVPWGEVLIITSQIKLKSRGADLGLAGAETRIAAWLREIPGAE
jgi:hypothetical protein